MTYYSVEKLIKMGGIGPYRSRYGILRLIEEGILDAVVRTGKAGGKRYYIPEFAIKDAQKRILEKGRQDGRV